MHAQPSVNAQEKIMQPSALHKRFPESPGDTLEILLPGLHPRPTTAESQGVDIRHHIILKSQSDFIVRLGLGDIAGGEYSTLENSIYQLVLWG